MIAGITAVSSVAFATHVAWPWYTVIGALVTVGVGAVFSAFVARPVAHATG